MMPKKRNNYYLKRFINQENIVHELSIKKQGQLKSIYREARRELENNLAFFIERYAIENEFTLADLEKMLNIKEKAEFRYTIGKYIKEIEKLGINTKEGKALKKELDIMAGRTRVSRKQELITSINYELGKTSLKAQKIIGKHLSQVVDFVINDTNNIIGGNTLTKLDPKLIERIVNQKWDSKNYSDRVWSNRKGLARKVMKNITTSFIQGYDFKKMSDRLVKDMNVGYYEARRIIETETTGALENAKAETFKEIGITKYKFIATIDDRTSEICRSLDGRIFDMKDRQIGVNCPFMHPFCRSVTVPVLDKEINKNVARSEFNYNIKNIIENEFGKLGTTEVILRNERLEHIKERHPDVVDLLKNNFNKIIKNPDYILKDSKNEDTIWHIKKVEEKNMNMVIKLSISDKKEYKGYLNSVITAHILEEKRLSKSLIKKKTIYKKI